MDENASLLEKIYRTSRMELEATQLILPKVQDPLLRKRLEDQATEYHNIGAKAKQLLRSDGRMPQPEKTMRKAVLRGSIQLNTMMNQSSSHISKLMINGTAMGISDMTKNLNRLDGADIETKKLAENYIMSEQKNIDELKKHL